MRNSSEILKDYWGYSSFRPLQQEIIHAVINGHDTLAVLPTGGGKSICFQVPAMHMDGICLVVSPLIALIKDQVENLKKKGIPALALYSGLKYIEVKKILQNASFGNYKFLYVSPERLESSLFLEYLPALPINIIAVDEAHCVSQWGYDFRPPYLRIASIRAYFPNVPVLALTASATKTVAKDIIEKLAFRKDYEVFNQSFARPNLSYSTFLVDAKENKLLEIVKNVSGSGIVYCKSRRKTKEVADLLQLNGISSSYYHAGLSIEQRTVNQKEWIDNKTRIICCTNAFGMGIDKADVKVVVHYDIPESLENYYQEAGRAGRDGTKAYAVLLYRNQELVDLSEIPNIKLPSKEVVKNVYRALVNYFQLPAESGENVYFNFNLEDFSKKFKLNSYEAVHALKMLQQEDYIAYADAIFLPPTVMFTATKEELEIFEETYPNFEPLIKSLLRTYNGIFDFPAKINEKQLSKMLEKGEASLKEDLNFLNRTGMIEYTIPSLEPQIQFLKPRVRTDDLLLNESAIAKRKQTLETRIKGMTDYVVNKTTCRSVFIGNYFGDDKLGDCGICDNCINNKVALNNINPEQLLQMITRQKGGINLEDLLVQINQSKEVVWNLLEFLIAENRIIINGKGCIEAKKKGPR